MPGTEIAEGDTSSAAQAYHLPTRQGWVDKYLGGTHRGATETQHSHQPWATHHVRSNVILLGDNHMAFFIIVELSIVFRRPVAKFLQCMWSS